MKLGVVTINIGRPQILRLWLTSIQRLRREVGWFPVVCVSEREDEAICKKHGIHHIYQKNDPATFKWNTGVKYMLTQDVDYVLVNDSDDIISTELLKNIIAKCEEGIGIVGIDNCYFYCSDGRYRGILLHYQASVMMGISRAIRRDILEKIDGVICPTPKNWGMNAIVNKTIYPLADSRVTVPGMCVDVKSSKNINRFTFWLSKLKNHIKPQLFYDILSEEERRELGKIQ